MSTFHLKVKDLKLKLRDSSRIHSRAEGGDLRPPSLPPASVPLLFGPGLLPHIVITVTWQYVLTTISGLSGSEALALQARLP